MVDQTNLNRAHGNGNGRPPVSVQPVVKKLGDVAHDVATLIELQAQLLAVDAKECSQRLRLFGVMLLASLALAWACLPILLASVALLLVQVFEVTYATGFLLTLLIGVVTSAGLAMVSWREVRKGVGVLKRSQVEFKRNLQWAKGILKRSRTGSEQPVLSGRDSE